MTKSDACRNVVYVVEDSECAQFRYRVGNVVEILRGSAMWTVRYYLKEEISKIDFSKVDILVILRQTAKDGKILKLIRRAHRMGVKVLFDLDDLVFDYRDLGVLVDSVREKNKLYWMGYVWGVRRIAKKVDGFTCTNGFLAEKLKRSFGKPAEVIRNSLNQKQVEVSDGLVNKKESQKVDKSGFAVGYFSGSSTHTRDFAMVESELVKFLERYDDVIMRVVGHMELSDRMKKWVDVKRVEILDLADYLKLQELMAEVDVNIAPLVINDFTNCKSELKFFEAAVVETTTIASPTYTFARAIKDGENGFLAQPGEWYEKLEYLYKHPEENRRMAKRAREYVLKHYYGKEFLKEVEAAYDYFAK